MADNKVLRDKLNVNRFKAPSPAQTVMEVPLLDLRAQYKTIQVEIKTAINEVCESQRFILGPVVKAFEDAIASYSNTSNAIGVSSGTDALLISLMALDIKPEDEIITTPYSFFATAGVIARLGAKPVFVDIDPLTYNIDPAQIEEHITKMTKAVMPVHLYGQCCDMKPILDIAHRHNLFLIEDAAQAIGAECKGKKKAGSMGDLGCFSFFPSKNLGGFGDGGMVVTNNHELAKKVETLRAHGSNPKYCHKIIGGNFRLDSLQSAILNVKLRYLDGWTIKRQENAETYDKLFTNAGLTDNGNNSPVKQPYTAHENRHIFNQYVIRVKDRNKLQNFLKANGIGTEVYYPLPLHLQECFSNLGHKEGEFPESERAAKETLALPIYPELTQAQQEYVVNKIKEFYQSLV